MFTVFTWLTAIAAWTGLYIFLSWQWYKFRLPYHYDRWLIYASSGFAFTLIFICYWNIFKESQLIIRLANMIVEVPFSMFIGIVSFFPWLLVRGKQAKNVILFHVLDCCYWVSLLSIVVGGFVLCFEKIIPIVVHDLQTINIDKEYVFVLLILFYLFIALMFGCLIYCLWLNIRHRVKKHK